MKIYKKDHHAMIFQLKNADVRGLWIRTHADKGRGKWAKIGGRPLWMAP